MTIICERTDIPNSETRRKKTEVNSDDIDEENRQMGKTTSCPREGVKDSLS